MERQLAWAIGCIFLVVISFFLYFHKWDDAVAGGGDSWGYYTYLPSVIIHQDLKDLADVIKIRSNGYPGSVHQDEKGQYRIGEATNVEGSRIIKYTYGLSIFYLPGFLISHLYAILNPSIESDGFSHPYIFMLYFSTIIYVFIGLIFIWNLLTRYFNKTAATTTIIILGLGTNLFYFMVWNNVMAHPILFFLWSVILYFSDRYHYKNNSLDFLIAVAACSAVSIIRPVEVLCFLVPIWWGGGNLFTRIKELLAKRKLVIATVLIGLLFLLPQLLYWKYTSGHWIFDSYPEEGFQFDDPHLWQGLFGFMNGWLPYSPLMILSIIGMVMMLRSQMSMKWLIVTVFGLHVYIIYSWWNWYYINGFGSRPMVDIYPLLAIPIGYLISKVGSRFIKWSGSILITGCVVLNVFQVYQHDRGILWTELGNMGYYLQTFGQTSFGKRISIALDMNEYQINEYQTLDTIYHEGFEGRSYAHISDSIYYSGSSAYHITSEALKDFGMVELPYRSVFPESDREASHFYLSLDIYVEEQITSFYEFETLILEYVREDESIYKRRYLRLNNKPGEDNEISLWWGSPRKWDRIELGFRISSRFKEGHKFRMFFNKENQHSHVYVDNLTLYTAVK